MADLPLRYMPVPAELLDSIDMDKTYVVERQTGATITTYQGVHLTVVHGVVVFDLMTASVKPWNRNAP